METPSVTLFSKLSFKPLRTSDEDSSVDSYTYRTTYFAGPTVSLLTK